MEQRPVDADDEREKWDTRMIKQNLALPCIYPIRVKKDPLKCRRGFNCIAHHKERYLKERGLL